MGERGTLAAADGVEVIFARSRTVRRAPGVTGWQRALAASLAATVLALGGGAVARSEVLPSEPPVAGLGEHPTGLVPADPGVAAISAPLRFAAALAATPALPSRVDLRAHTVPVGNQGSLGSCTSWALGYAIAGWYATKDRHYGVPFSAPYLYALAHRDDGSGRMRGSTTLANYSVMAVGGIAEKASGTRSDTDATSRITTAERISAAQHKGTTPIYLFTSRRSAVAAASIKAALAAGKPVLLGIDTGRGFQGLSSADSVMTAAKATGAAGEPHAVAAFGYDATGVQIQNSWGTRWGRAGWATLSWDFVAGHVFEASTLSAGLAGQTAPPAVTTLSAHTASTAGGSALTVTGTNLAWVNAAAVDAVRMVGPGGITRTAAVRSRTSSTLTVALPAGPAGRWQVRVRGPGGVSVEAGSADDVTYLAANSAAQLVGPAAAAATGGTWMSVTGWSFGDTPAAFAAGQYVARVGSTRVPLTRVDPVTVRFVVPAGVAGSTGRLILTSARTNLSR